MATTFQKYNFSTNRYTTSQNIPREKPLNGFTVTNLGNTPLQINGVTLGPPIAPAIVGDSISFGGNEGEIFVDRITLSFIPPLVNPLCEITQKYYITPKSFDK